MLETPQPTPDNLLETMAKKLANGEVTDPTCNHCKKITPLQEVFAYHTTDLEVNGEFYRIISCTCTACQPNGDQPGLALEPDIAPLAIFLLYPRVT